MQAIPLNTTIKVSSKYPSLSLLLEKSLQGSPRGGNFDNSEQCYWYEHYV